MIRERSIIIWPTFLSQSLQGLLFAAVGASLPAIQEHFSLGIEQVGLVSAVLQLAFAAFCTIGGILTDFFGKNRILMTGGLLYGTCAILLGAPHAFAANMGLLALIGIGAGLVFIASNTLVVQLYPERRGTYLNLHHLFYAVGSVLAPLLTSALLSRGHRWDTVFEILGVLALLTGLFFVFTDPSASARVVPGFDVAPLRGRLRQYGQMLRQRLFLYLLAVAMLGVGAQFSIVYLLILFLTRTRGLTLPGASLVLASFFVLLGVGRLICGALITRHSIARIVVLLQGLLTACLLAAWLTRGAMSAVFFALAGLASSGLVPSLLALTSLVLPQEVTGSALGVFSMFGALGGMAITYGTTWIAAAVGLNLGFLAIPAISMLAVFLLAAVHAPLREGERRRS